MANQGELAQPLESIGQSLTECRLIFFLISCSLFLLVFLLDTTLSCVHEHLLLQFVVEYLSSYSIVINLTVIIINLLLCGFVCS